MKLVAGLGNPGPEYDDTRHNVGWWMVDRLAWDWGFPSFEQEGRALVSTGRVGAETVLLAKPTTFMNRSGAALARLREDRGLAPQSDVLVVVDDAALDVGRVRLRPGGGAGGHNGLRSVSAALGSEDYARLRIGVGGPPEGESLVNWVLSPMPPEDEDAVLALLPELTSGVEVWLEEGVAAAMNRLNR